VECQIGALRGDLSKLTEALSKLCNLDGEEQLTASRGHGGKEYVF
jgi:hypothetical protein